MSLVLVLAAGCASGPVADSATLAERQRITRLEVQTQRTTFSAKLLQRVLAKIDSAQGGVPLPVDILMLSGGGEYGAFGVGVLQGWRETGPLPQPEFDVVTGVSTGALIAPFALLGTEDSIGHVDQLYRQTDRAIAVLRDIFFFLPWRESFYDNSALQRRVHDEINAPLAQRIAAAYDEGRLLLIGTTDLDLGRMRVWDFGLEAQRALAAESCDKLANIILASAAIPPVFPPIAIDNALYVDGGASQQAVSGLDLGQFQSVVREARRLRPDARLPSFRMWVIVNGPLDDPVQATAPRWDSVAKRTVRLLMSYSKRVTLRHFQFGTALFTAETGVPFEFRYVAVPDDFPRPPEGVLFDQPFMVKLAELGRRVGAAASSWQTTVAPVEELDAETFQPRSGLEITR